MRTLKELYSLVLETLINTEHKWSVGICGCIGLLACSDQITGNEYLFLHSHFNTKRPSMLSRFYWNKNYISGEGFWWKRTEEGYKQRVKFVKHLIKTV